MNKLSTVDSAAARRLSDGGFAGAGKGAVAEEAGAGPTRFPVQGGAATAEGDATWDAKDSKEANSAGSSAKGGREQYPSMDGAASLDGSSSEEGEFNSMGGNGIGSNFMPTAGQAALRGHSRLQGAGGPENSVSGESTDSEKYAVPGSVYAWWRPRAGAGGGKKPTTAAGIRTWLENRGFEVHSVRHLDGPHHPFEISMEDRYLETLMQKVPKRAFLAELGYAPDADSVEFRSTLLFRKIKTSPESKRIVFAPTDADAVKVQEWFDKRKIKAKVKLVPANNAGTHHGIIEICMSPLNALRMLRNENGIAAKFLRFMGFR